MSSRPEEGRSPRLALAACAVVLMAASPATSDSRSLAEVSLDEFLNTEVTSVSRRAQRLVEAPSAVFVITSEDIRRSGHTSVPELLRMVPGLHVAREDSNSWSITSRGFNSRFANKLLVLIDGRSVYTPLFSGVYWDIQDVMLEDIERIEVIRGPGATVWGANAVNGVINIITRTAAESEGNLISIAAGNEDRLIATYRYGGQISHALGFRVSGKLSQRDDSVVRGTGVDSADEWRLGRTSVRVDYQPNARDTLTLSSDLYKGDAGRRVRVDTLISRLFGVGFTIQNDNARVRGGDVILRWNRQISEDASTELQVSYDVRNRDDIHLDERRRQLDLSFTHQLALGNHDLIWGMGWRLDRDRISDTQNVGLDGHGRKVLYSMFVQDEFDLVPETLRLTAGSKLEWNSFTGWEVQPSVRLLATPTERQQLWASVSRAVRTPSRADHGLTAFLVFVVPGGFLGCPAAFPLACPVDVLGTEDFESEELWSYEIGYRAQPKPNLSFDVAAYWNEYENLSMFIPDPVIPLNFRFDNGEEARGWGVEVAAQWQVTDGWRLSAAYTGANLRSNESKVLGTTLPHHQASLRSSINLPGHVELDTAAYFVGHADLGQNLIFGQQTEVQSYVRFDARIAWWPRPDLELSLVGQNLFESEQIEWIDTVTTLPTQEIERAFYAKLSWRF